MARANRKITLDTAATPEEGLRRCDWLECGCEGLYRAPRSRNELRSYRWFCMEHVRTYNAAWNYYAGMDEDEVEADVRRDTVWRRPTWPLGGADPRFILTGVRFSDSSRHFGAPEDADHGAGPCPPQPRGPEGKALAILGLKAPVTLAAIKTRYKELVKRYHPDANGGDKASEEKFKQISHAYQTVREAMAT